jgi:uncharacterized membrane protein YeaQ/YmgE (transglycosylase-associated protein family)
VRVRSSGGLVTNLGLGITGAVGGGVRFSAFDASQPIGLDVLGLAVNATGATAVPAARHALFPHTPRA